MEACVARKHLKKRGSVTRGSEDHQKLASSEALSSEVIYQKLTSSEAENWKLKLVKVVIQFGHLYRKNRSME